MMDNYVDESLEALGNAVRQLREELDNKADVGSFDAQFERIEMTLGQLVELLWRLAEVIGPRFDGIETRLDTIETRLDAVETRLDSIERRLDAGGL